MLAMLLRALVRLALLGLLVYLLYRFVRYLYLALRQPESGHTSHGRHSEPMVLDPECGTHIPLSDALRAEVHGHTRHFCSRECRDAYLKKHH